MVGLIVALIESVGLVGLNIVQIDRDLLGHKFIALEDWSIFSLIWFFTWV